MGHPNCMGYNNFDVKNYDGPVSYPIVKEFKELGDTSSIQFVDVRTPA